MLGKRRDDGYKMISTIERFLGGRVRKRKRKRGLQKRKVTGMKMIWPNFGGGGGSGKSKNRKRGKINTLISCWERRSKDLSNKEGGDSGLEDPLFISYGGERARTIEKQFYR